MSVGASRCRRDRGSYQSLRARHEIKIYTTAEESRVSLQSDQACSSPKEAEPVSRMGKLTLQSLFCTRTGRVFKRCCAYPHVGSHYQCRLVTTYELLHDSSWNPVPRKSLTVRIRHVQGACLLGEKTVLTPARYNLRMNEEKTGLIERCVKTGVSLHTADAVSSPCFGR